MFSSRFPRDFQHNQLTRTISGLRRAGAAILDLTASNPTQAAVRYPPEVLRAFDDERLLIYEPTPAGAPEPRAAICNYYLSRGVTVEPERVLLTASTSEAYAYLFKLLTDPGDHILVPRPSYPLFECLAAMESVELRSYPLSCHGGWAMDLDALTGVITDRSRAIIVVNPNNPTGNFLKKAELDSLVRLCAERELVLISDEVFSDYGFESDPQRVTTLANVKDCLAFSMSGLSKIAGLPQMKLGWIVAAGPADLRAEALERLEWIADAYLSVGTPVQHAAARLLAAGESIQQQIRERTWANLQFARQTLAGTSVNSLPVEGGWYLPLQVPRIRSEEQWALDLLSQCHVLVQPGFFYDFETEAFLVVSLLAEPAVFEEGLRRVARFLTHASVQ
jgi:hypothetical protein